MYMYMIPDMHAYIIQTDMLCAYTHAYIHIKKYDI